MNIKNHRLLATVAVGAVMASCGPHASTSGDLEGELSLSGAFALYPLAVLWAQDFEQLHPGVRVDISAGGAGKGMTDVLAGVVDLGMVSREVYPPEVEKGAVAFAVAKDAVVPTISAANPLLPSLLEHGLTREAAAAIWLSDTLTTWGQLLGTDDTTPLHAYTRPDACGAAETWAQWLGARQEDLGGTAVFGDPGVAAAVQKDIYGIGLNNIGYAYDNQTLRPNDGLQVLPIDTDADGRISDAERFYDDKRQLTAAIAAGRYPSPPARDLYLVSRGVPTSPVVWEFIRYVLAEGQRRNDPAGYIAIGADKIEASLALLDAQPASDPKNDQ